MAEQTQEAGRGSNWGPVRSWPPDGGEIEIWAEPLTPQLYRALQLAVRPSLRWRHDDKGKLRAQLEELSEQEEEHTQIIVRHPEPDVVGLPDSWGDTLTGEPMPNVVAAVRRVRGKH